MRLDSIGILSKKGLCVLGVEVGVPGLGFLSWSPGKPEVPLFKTQKENRMSQRNISWKRHESMWIWICRGEGSRPLGVKQPSIFLLLTIVMTVPTFLHCPQGSEAIHVPTRQRNPTPRSRRPGYLLWSPSAFLLPTSTSLNSQGFFLLPPRKKCPYHCLG